MAVRAGRMSARFVLPSRHPLVLTGPNPQGSAVPILICRCPAVGSSKKTIHRNHPREGPGADSEEKHEPVSDIDTALMDSLKVLDPEGPIREADMERLGPDFHS
jgi:hypothetical protein